MLNGCGNTLSYNWMPAKCSGDYLCIHPDADFERDVYLNWCLFIVNNKGKACIVVDCIGHKAVGMAWNIPLVAMASDQR